MSIIIQATFITYNEHFPQSGNCFVFLRWLQLEKNVAGISRNYSIMCIQMEKTITFLSSAGTEWIRL